MRSHAFKARTVVAVSLVALAGSTLSVGGALAGGKDAKSEHWGLVNRNTIGSPVADVRDGPYVISTTTGNLSAPPMGKGSLEIEVGSSSEKVAFGNETDFVGDPVSGLNQAGFFVFRTGEDVGYGGLNNLPNIQIEINPDLNPITYTSMVWVPDGTNVPVNEWSPYIDATTNGAWYFTGAAGGATGCSLGSPCSFAAAKAALGPNASILTVAVAKGRDSQFQGAIDGLRINNRFYDFESHPDGVKKKDAN